MSLKSTFFNFQISWYIVCLHMFMIISFSMLFQPPRNSYTFFLSFIFHIYFISKSCGVYCENICRFWPLSTCPLLPCWFKIASPFTWVIAIVSKVVLLASRTSYYSNCWMIILLSSRSSAMWLVLLLFDRLPWCQHFKACLDLGDITLCHNWVLHHYTFLTY